MIYTAEDVKRFNDKFNYQTTSECWNWEAGINNKGYGKFSLSSVGGDVYAHRFSYTIHNGEIPVDLIVMHSCDNPRCVNPRHLSVGTHQDNADDKVAKNRQARMFGEDNPASKLTEKQVIDIRTERISQAEFAKLYDIDSSQISRITNNLKWTNL
jgi:hypothetical protein